MAGDAHYATVVLRLPFDGSDGATSDIDKANSPATLTFQNGAKLSTTRFKYGPSSLFLDGANDNLNTNRSCNIGTGAFTFEAWIRCTGAQTGRIISNQDSGSPNAFFSLRVESTGSLRFLLRASSGGSLIDVQSATGLVTQNDTAWHHAAVTRDGSGNITIWLDGASVATGTSTVSPNGSGVGYNFGSQYNSTEYFKGYIDDARLNEGYCYYTGAFTPPTEALPTSLDYTPTGFLATNFGSPTASWTQFAQPSGFLATHFGTPLAVAVQICNASGFLATNFGAPRLVTLIGQASGFLTTHFGTPKNIPNAVGWRSVNFGHATARYILPATGFLATRFGLADHVQGIGVEQVTGIVTRFGTPTTPTNRDAQPKGFFAITMGEAVAIQFEPLGRARALPQTGWAAASFGKPTVAPRITCVASGWLATSFGTPLEKSRPVCHASALAPAVVFGAPRARATAHAAGFKSSHFGNPGAGQVQPAAALAPRTRFGTPGYLRGHAHMPYGWATARFGQPTCLLRFNKHASGFTSTQFGTAAALVTHRASMEAPQTRFGTPQALRNPKC